MAGSKHTPVPWKIEPSIYEHCACEIVGKRGIAQVWSGDNAMADAHLAAAAPDLLAALKEGRRAIGDHNAPSDCYATGPLTGDPIRDLVQCPACSFIAMYDAATARAEGR